MGDEGHRGRGSWDLVSLGRGFLGSRSVGRWSRGSGCSPPAVSLPPQGCLAPVRVIIPKGSILDPSPEAAVVGGNVLTSQRVVDVIFKAFGVCAASQVGRGPGRAGGDTGPDPAAGGVGGGPCPFPRHLSPGLHEQRHLRERARGLLRDGGGGRGGRSPLARPQRGAHAHDQHAHHRPRGPGAAVGAGPGGAALGPAPPDRAPPRYPVVLQRFELRRGSGGAGRYRGGDGVCRELLFRQDMVLSVLSERRAIQPYGLRGEPRAPRRAPRHPHGTPFTPVPRQEAAPAPWGSTCCCAATGQPSTWAPRHQCRCSRG